jgi:hypothetical protein
MIPDNLKPQLKDLAERAQLASVEMNLLKEELRVIQKDLTEKAFKLEEMYMMWSHQRFILREIKGKLKQLQQIRRQYDNRRLVLVPK